MIINATNSFNKIVKKLHPNQQKDLSEAVSIIRDNPEIGDEKIGDKKIGDKKIGDLKGIRVYKFKMTNQLTLMSYQLVSKDEIILLSLGSHQNFYDELKRKNLIL
jgi:mRNA-degrading endonuclease RelE of RelBE toxin-antitoxin system